LQILLERLYPFEKSGYDHREEKLPQLLVRALELWWALTER
jgi:hypothetical protein